MSTEPSLRLAQIALMWSGSLGPVGFRRLVGHFGSPSAVLEASVEELAEPALRLEPAQVRTLAQVRGRLPRAEEILEELTAQNIRVLCDVDDSYPRLLRGVRDRPPVLCVAGTLLAEDELAVAIVGTRQPTEAGAERARSLGQACVEAGLTVISGLALGCDTEAHRGALAGHGRTVAVLGSGIRAVTPRENLELARRIAEAGAVLSEQPPFAVPNSGRLLARNRLQVALSQAVIVVQAGPGGGAMSTAERAFRTGRTVYAVAWPAGLERARGNELLLERGARRLEGAAEISDLARVVRVALEHRPSEAAQPPLFGEE
jgi:DNA processing protein